jgi:hypothetical protein
MLLVFSSFIDFGTNGIGNADPVVAKFHVLVEREMKGKEGDIQEMIEGTAGNNTKVDNARMQKLQQFFLTAQQAQTVIMKRPIVMAAGFIGIGAYLLVGIWLLASLGFFRELTGVSAGKNVAAIVIAAVMTTAAFTIGELISAGAGMQQMMSQKYGKDTTATLASFVNEHGAATTVVQEPVQVSTNTIEANSPDNATSAAPTSNNTVTGTSQETKLYAAIDEERYELVVTSVTPAASGYMYKVSEPQKKLQFSMGANGSTYTISISDGGTLLAEAAMSAINESCMSGWIVGADFTSGTIVLCDKP